MRRDVCPRCDSHSVVTWHGVQLNPNVSCFDQIGYRCERCGRTYSYNQIMYYTTDEREAARIRRREYKRAWDAEHHDRVLENQRERRQRNRDVYNAKYRLRRAKDKEYRDHCNELQQLRRAKYKRKREDEKRKAMAEAWEMLSRNSYKPRERTREMAGHETVRSTDLSALQGIFFEELDNLMSLDINGDDEAIEREINRAKAVSDVGARAIENANTAVDIIRARSEMVGAKLASVPAMLKA